MATKASEFDKVLSAWDVLVLAFGAMIGWGWVVSTGDWITRGGVIGSMAGFAIGGLMVFFVGLTYAELTSAMPQCGGEHVFSYKAMGPVGSFICTWAIILGYVGVVCFEACALPTIITYVYPDFLTGYLYTVEGFKIYASWLAVAVVTALFITYINIRGAKTAAILQTILTVIIGGVGILLIGAAAVTGNTANLEGQLVSGFTVSDAIKGMVAVAVMTPFYFIGFDVIPQAAEEITVSLKKIGRILILSIVLAVLFYALIIAGVGYVLNPGEVATSMNGVGGLVTADAMAMAFHSSAMAKVLIIGGLCGIITSWNSFMIGGSRAMYSMAESYMIPRTFCKLHDTYKTPVNALLFIGLLSVIAPFFGRKMLVWVVDAGNFGCCVAYCMVAISFILLRTKEPHMARPYKVSHYKIVGALAVLMSGFMVAMYVIPDSPAALVPQEWTMVSIWIVLGIFFGFYCKAIYKDRFATHVDVAIESAQPSPMDLAFGRAMDHVLENAKKTDMAAPAALPVSFTFASTTPLIFGRGRIDSVKDVIKDYGKKAFLLNDRSITTTSPAYTALVQSLKDTGIDGVPYPTAHADTPETIVAQGVQDLKEEGCDMIIALGQSAIMDCAKQIAYEVSRQAHPVGPLFFVPTTFDCVSAFTNAFTFHGNTVWHPQLQAKAAIAGPDLMKTMKDDVKPYAAFMAFCRCLSACVDPQAEPLTTALALYGLKVLYQHSRKGLLPDAAGSDWEQVALAGITASLISSTASTTLIDGLERVVTEKTDFDGAYLAGALMPSLVRAVLKTDIFAFGKVARQMGGFTSDDCPRRIQHFATSLGVQKCPEGMDESRMDAIVAACLAYWKKADDKADEASQECILRRVALN